MCPQQIQRGASMKRGESVWRPLIWTVSLPWRYLSQERPWGGTLSTCVEPDPKLSARFYGADVCFAFMKLAFLERGQTICGYDTNKQLGMFKYGSQARDKEVLSTIKEASEIRPSRRDESFIKGSRWAPFVSEPPGTALQLRDDFWFCKKILMVPPSYIF